MRIGIAARWLTYHDAVSSDVFGMHEALKDAGHDVHIFCEDRHWRTLGKPIKNVKKISNILAHKNDLVIYHYTSGWRHGMQFLNRLKCKKIVRYHGITPSEFFRGISLSHEERAQDGHESLNQLNNINIDAFMTNSMHSAQELSSAGVTINNYFVIPPLHLVEKLLTQKPKACFKKRLLGANNVLSIGRLAPHKGHLDLIKGFAHYNKEHNGNSRLIICGKQNKHLSKYTDSIRALINDKGIDDQVLIIKEGSERTIKTLYAMANVYVAASQHEGFCVPIIESMAHRVPVIGRNTTAITETMYSSGLLWESDNPEELGSLIHRIEANHSLRKDIQERGWNSYEKYYSLKRIGKQLCSAVNTLERRTLS